MGFDDSGPGKLSRNLQQLLCLPHIFELQLKLQSVELSSAQQQALSEHRGLRCLMLFGLATRVQGAFPHVKQLIMCAPDWTSW